MVRVLINRPEYINVANDVIEIYVDESTDQTQLPAYTVTTPA